MTLRFRDDGTFRILQVSDIQDGPHVSEDTLQLIGDAVREADPDLVVLTGDQIRGYDPAYIDTFISRRGDRPGDHVRVVSRLEAAIEHVPSQRELCRRNTLPAPDEDTLMERTRQNVRSTFSQFLGPIAAHGVPFAATYGNHDFQCGIDVDEQDDLYREIDGCLNPVAGSGPLALEPGTFALPVLSSRGERIAMGVMMVNSGDYALDGDASRAVPSTGPVSSGAHPVVQGRGLDLVDSDGYGVPSAAAIGWLADAEHELSARNGDGMSVPAIAFQHIPTQEFYDCLCEVPWWTMNAVEGTRAFSGRCFLLDETVCRPGSTLGESVNCADINVGEVAAMRHAGGYFALFAGHDHKNAYVGHAGGLDLGYAPTCGFASYGPDADLRGVRLLTFREDNPSAYHTRMITWGELGGGAVHDKLRVFLGDYGAADAATVRNQLRRPKVAGTIGVAAAGLLGAIAAHRRRQ